MSKVDFSCLDVGQISLRVIKILFTDSTAWSSEYLHDFRAQMQIKKFLCSWGPLHLHLAWHCWLCWWSGSCHCYDCQALKMRQTNSLVSCLLSDVTFAYREWLCLEASIRRISNNPSPWIWTHISLATHPFTMHPSISSLPLKHLQQVNSPCHGRLIFDQPYATWTNFWTSNCLGCLFPTRYLPSEKGSWDGELNKG